MSMVNKVLLLLKMEVREDIRAAIITAIIKPRSPETHATHNAEIPIRLPLAPRQHFLDCFIPLTERFSNDSSFFNGY